MADALGIVWFLTKEDYYTHGAQHITIYNDAKNMGSFMYNFEVKYKPGKEMAVADFGSRSPCLEEAHEDVISGNNEIVMTVKSLICYM